MIPKIIHYCWFGGKPLPKEHNKYIEEWKKLMPDYQFKKWDESNFDINKYRFAKEAFDAGKLAYVADYCRVLILYNEGGIYLDTDVRVQRRFDEYLNCTFFSSYECHLKPNERPIGVDANGKKINSEQKKVIECGIMSAAIAGVAGSMFLKECLDFYNNVSFEYVMKFRQTIPTVLANHAEKYGFKYKDEFQCLHDGIVIYPSNVFANYDNFNKYSTTIHYCAGSWNKKSTLKRIRGKLYRIAWLRKIVQYIKYKL